MLTQIPLSPPLTRLLDEVCAVNAPTCKHGDCVNGFDGSLESIGCQMLTLKKPRIEPNAIRDVECNRCVLVIALTAIDEHVKPEELETWMNTPNIDMHGQTPISCIRKSDYEPIFKALWMREPAVDEVG